MTDHEAVAKNEQALELLTAEVDSIEVVGVSDT